MLRTTGNVKMMMSRKSRGLSAGALRSCKAFEGMMSMRVSLWNNSRIRVELLFERHELLWDNKLWMRAWPLPLALVTSCRRPWKLKRRLWLPPVGWRLMPSCNAPRWVIPERWTQLAAMTCATACTQKALPAQQKVMHQQGVIMRWLCLREIGHLARWCKKHGHLPWLSCTIDFKQYIQHLPFICCRHQSHMQRRESPLENGDACCTDGILYQCMVYWINQCVDI